MLSVLRLVRCRTLDHMISMSANTETQFPLFDRPSSRDAHQAPRQQRRAQLPDLVRDVSQLENDDLIDLIRVALDEARRRGMASAASGSSRIMPPVMEQKNPAAARIRIVRNTAPRADIPPAKASMVRAAVRAGFSPARVAKDFGVSTATVRKLMAP
jgi:DNA-directed RNA polymerase specialized sigma24 family protein